MKKKIPVRDMEVRSVRIKNRVATVWIDHQTLPKKRIVIMNKVGGVADWSRSRNEIRIENEVVVEPRRFLVLLSLHETVEAWLVREYKVSLDYAHRIAEHLEKKYCLKKYGKKTWKIYTKWINFVHAKNSYGM